MKRIHIVGRQNGGKTAMIADLLHELRRRGIRAGTIKHTRHAYPLDSKGKDSFRHREAGAEPAAFLSGAAAAVFLDLSGGGDCYQRLQPFFAEADLVLVEGDIESTAPKIEVWRAAVSEPPLACSRDDILALVTDDPVEVPIQVWPRTSILAIADGLLEALVLRESAQQIPTRTS